MKYLVLLGIIAATNAAQAESAFTKKVSMIPSQKELCEQLRIQIDGLMIPGKPDDLDVKQWKKAVQMFAKFPKPTAQVNEAIEMFLSDKEVAADEPESFMSLVNHTVCRNQVMRLHSKMRDALKREKRSEVDVNAYASAVRSHYLEGWQHPALLDMSIAGAAVKDVAEIQGRTSEVKKIEKVCGRARDVRVALNDKWEKTLPKAAKIERKLTLNEAQKFKSLIVMEFADAKKLYGDLLAAAGSNEASLDKQFHALAGQVRSWASDAKLKSHSTSARGDAEKLLDLSRQFQADWEFGNAVHHANLSKTRY